MRARYAAEERELDKHVYEIRPGQKPDTSMVHAFEYVPTELPKIEDMWHEYFYIINLDREILTMNFSLHWKLNNIPRDDLWLRAIVKSIYAGEPTISLDICPEEHIACPALDLREPNREVGYNSTAVTLMNIDVQEARTIFLTGVMASTLIAYHNTIIRFGREWSPESFPFREMTFALVSIASGQAKFHSFHAQPCDPRECGHTHGRCRLTHLQPRESYGWLDEKWAGDYAPLPEFGSMSHRPGDPPGASPMETKYWVEDVLVSLTLVVDGEAITEAVTWGIKEGRAGFQIVVLSLFQVAFAEVFSKDGEPFVRATEAVNLSPLLAEYCVSTHPRERPERKPGMQKEQRQGENVWEVIECTGTPERLRDHFPGLMSLVKFFDVAGSRRAASKSTKSSNSGAGQGASSEAPVILPPEMHDRILDFVDYDTWKACLVVSPKFRSYCLRKFRLDNRWSLVGGPFEEESNDREPRLSFEFEDAQTGRISWKMQAPRGSRRTEECSWMPLIGTDRKALMSDVVFQFETVS